MLTLSKFYRNIHLECIKSKNNILVPKGGYQVKWLPFGCWKYTGYQARKIDMLIAKYVGNPNSIIKFANQYKEMGIKTHGSIGYTFHTDNYTGKVAQLKKQVEFLSKKDRGGLVGLKLRTRLRKLGYYGGVGGRAHSMGPCLLSMSISRINQGVYATISWRVAEMTRALICDFVLIENILQSVLGADYRRLKSVNLCFGHLLFKTSYKEAIRIMIPSKYLSRNKNEPMKRTDYKSLKNVLESVKKHGPLYNANGELAAKNIKTDFPKIEWRNIRASL